MITAYTSYLIRRILTTPQVFLPPSTRNQAVRRTWSSMIRLYRTLGTGVRVSSHRDCRGQSRRSLFLSLLDHLALLLCHHHHAFFELYISRCILHPLCCLCSYSILGMTIHYG